VIMIIDSIQHIAYDTAHSIKQYCQSGRAAGGLPLTGMISYPGKDA
jgi:hypothetical protein